MRLTGAFMTLCALVACSQGRQASLATPVVSYNGSHPFPAVIGEPIALTPPVSQGRFLAMPIGYRDFGSGVRPSGSDDITR